MACCSDGDSDVACCSDDCSDVLSSDAASGDDDLASGGLKVSSSSSVISNSEVKGESDGAVNE